MPSLDQRKAGFLLPNLFFAGRESIRKCKVSSNLSSPARIYQYFCTLKKRDPGELSLKTKLEFRGFVGRVYINPQRKEHWAKLGPIFAYWNAEIEKQSQRRNYVKRKRKSITNDLWDLLGLLYWNYAAWIILRGEYKGLKKTLSENEETLSKNEIEQRLEEILQDRYQYLSQIQHEGWFDEIKTTQPRESAYQDMVERLELKEWKLNKDALRVMLSSKRLRESPPACLITATMDSKKLLSRLMRISPSRRTRKDRLRIHVIKGEAY